MFRWCGKATKFNKIAEKTRNARMGVHRTIEPGRLASVREATDRQSGAFWRTFRVILPTLAATSDQPISPKWRDGKASAIPFHPTLRSSDARNDPIQDILVVLEQLNPSAKSGPPVRDDGEVPRIPATKGELP